MRVVFVGVSHWHTPLYLEPARETPGIEIVGVSDADLGRAKAVGERAGCAAWDDHREMCARLRPDFAFAFGRHSEMASTARSLIEQRVAFAMEKPCGVNAAEVTDLARRAREAGVFASVGFVMRLSPMLTVMRDVADGEAIQYLSFKFIAGTVDRYRQARVDWMLHRATAGGGAVLNLGVHFVDLCRVMLPAASPVVVGAAMSNTVAGLDIEDHGLVLLRAGPVPCSIETGYAYPAPSSVFDMHFSIRTARHYFTAPDMVTFEIVDEAQRRETRAIPTTNVACYPLFVRDAVRRAERGEPPIADLDDMAQTMRLVEAAYLMAPLPRAAGERR
jgi:predicted dehydrogenase